jgi:hypothetical protein
LVKASDGAAQWAEARSIPLALRTLSNSGNEGGGAAGEAALTIHHPNRTRNANGRGSFPMRAGSIRHIVAYPAGRSIVAIERFPDPDL